LMEETGPVKSSPPLLFQRREPVYPPFAASIRYAGRAVRMFGPGRSFVKQTHACGGSLMRFTLW